MFVAAVRTLWGFAKLVPWWIYVLIAAVLYHVAAIHVAESRGRDEANAAWTKKEAARVAAQAAVDADAKAKLEALQTRFVAQQLADQEAAAQAEAEHKSQLAALEGRKVDYVSALIVANYPNVPRGYLVLRADAAAYANGADYPKPPGPDPTLSEPSSVSLAALADTDIAQAEAYRAAVAWGRQWQSAALHLNDACRQTIEILTGEKQ